MADPYDGMKLEYADVIGKKAAVTFDETEQTADVEYVLWAGKMHVGSLTLRVPRAAAIEMLAENAQRVVFDFRGDASRARLEEAIRRTQATVERVPSKG